MALGNFLQERHFYGVYLGTGVYDARLSRLL
jgi:hypothetical protein